MKIINKKAFFSSLVLGLAICLLQLIALMDHYFGGFHGKAHDVDVVSQFLKLNVMAHWPFISFLLIVLIGYLLWGYCVYCASQILAKRKSQRSAQYFVWRLWIVTYLALLIINSRLYPNSLFAIQFFSTHSHFPTLSLLSSIVAYFILAVLFLLVVIRLGTALKNNRVLRISFFAVILVLLLVALGFRVFSHKKQTPVAHTKQHQLPDIVMIIYCSFKYHLLTQLTHFKQLAAQSADFTRVLSPIARSGPATYAILSGLYPATSHYFFNLNWADQRIPFNATLPHRLKKLGYHTAFMTNINLFRRLDTEHNWGFDQIVSPPTSIYALGLGKINDLPLTNLFFSTPLAKYLFPYNYNNADDVIHYNPADFTNGVHDFLRSVPRKHPVFLVINDESMHFPYQIRSHLSGGVAVRYAKLGNMFDHTLMLYQQFLKQADLLNHTLLVVTADHGESSYHDEAIQPLLRRFEQGVKTSQDKVHILKKHKLNYAVIVGHGSDVLDSGQYHVPLLFRFYGESPHPIQPKKMSALVSLTDIAPTVLNLLGVSDHHLDGQSLLPAMRGEPLLKRVVFTQTGMAIVLPKTDEELKSVAYKSAKNYYLDESGAFAMKQSIIDAYKSRLHFAAYYNQLQLAYHPAFQEGEKTIPAIYALTDFDKTHLFLFKQDELDALLKGQGEAEKVNKALKTNTETLIFLHQKLMDYVKKALKSG